MNKTVTVNIGGIVFHIDENAYERFRQYLESIRSHFTQSEGRDEIMEDIESRIAEMFQEKLRESKNVITLEDVEQVTSQMGRPEEFGAEADNQSVQPEGTSSAVRKRLFRNPDDKLLGGVCSGVASYFDIDAIWIRLAFVFIFFAFGSGIVLYIILWIIMPEARTTAEKLQMRGERINVSNIEKNVKEELRFSESAKDGVKKEGTVVGRIFEAIGEIFKFFFIFLGKLIAIFFILIGLVVAFGMIMSVPAFLGVPGTTYPHLWRLIFDSATQFSFAYIGLLLFVGIPFLMLAYAGARILFNIRKGNKVVGLTALGLWLIGLGICVFIGVRVAADFREGDNIRTSITLMQPPQGKIYLEMAHNRNEEKDYGVDYGRNWKDDFNLRIDDDSLYSNNLKVDIVKSPIDSFEIVEIFYARGGSRKSAIENATRINYSFVQKDSLLTLQRYFSVDRIQKYRGQKVQILLRVPVGAQVYLDKSMGDYIYDIDNVQNIWDNDMLERTWKMTSKGLSCVDCDGSESSIDGERFEFYDEGDEHRIRIDNNGVHITGPDGEKVAIDSNGIIIKDGGKTKIRIKSDSRSPDVPVPPAVPIIP